MTAQLFITLPNGSRVALGEYVRSWRILKELHGDRLVGRFSHFPEPARAILEEISRGMHARINRHIPGYGVGRKWEDDWQRETANAARQLNTPRLVIHWLPKWIAARFPDRLPDREFTAAAMPWCGNCRCYHHNTADHLSARSDV